MNKKAQTNLKTKWDLTSIYKNDKDPQIEQDIKDYVKWCSEFSKKHRAKTDYLENAAKLLNVLKMSKNKSNIHYISI